MAQYLGCHTESTGAGLFATVITSLTFLLLDTFFLLNFFHITALVTFSDRLHLHQSYCNMLFTYGAG